MSMERCEKCSRAIDTDSDVDCYVYTGNYRRLHSHIVLCESCRDKHFEELEAQDAIASQAEYDATKNQE